MITTLDNIKKGNIYIFTSNPLSLLTETYKEFYVEIIENRTYMDIYHVDNYKHRELFRQWTPGNSIFLKYNVTELGAVKDYPEYYL